METVDATTDIRNALCKLGYKLTGHKIGVVRIMVDLFKVYYDDQYFGVWDGYRKTFID